MTKLVLIVEDNELNMSLFEALLVSDGYEILQSPTGGDVIEIANGNKLDLIVMDIQLPGRSGLEITKELKANDALKHIPVVAVTAFAMSGDEEKILAAGCDAYLAKPIDFQSFLDTIAKYIL